MGVWISVTEIIDQHLLKDIDLIELIRTNQLIAYGKGDLLPVEWELFEKKFNEINDFIEFICDYKDDEFSLLKKEEYYPDYKWNDLHKELYDYVSYIKSFIKNNQDPIIHRFKISEYQYDQINFGWNINIFFEFIEDCIFLTMDINKLISIFKINSTYCEYDIKSETDSVSKNIKSLNNNLLKIIGALVKINYSCKLSYMNGNNLNFSAIKNHIHEELAKIDIGVSGIDDSALRHKLKEGYTLFTSELPEIIQAAQEELEKNKLNQKRSFDPS